MQDDVRAKDGFCHVEKRFGLDGLHPCTGVALHVMSVRDHTLFTADFLLQLSGPLGVVFFTAAFKLPHDVIEVLGEEFHLRRFEQPAGHIVTVFVEAGLDLLGSGHNDAL